MPLPNLAGLGLGPSTGPMAVYGIPTYPGDEDDGRETNPRASKHRRGEAGRSLPGLVVYKPEEGNPLDPITQEPFVPGQMVYKTPHTPPVNYDPYALYTLWSMNHADGKATVDATNKKVLPESEFAGLSAWVQAHPKPESPPASIDWSTVSVFQNPKNPDGTEHVPPPQPPVDPMEGMLAVEPALDTSMWNDLSYERFAELVLHLSGRRNIQEFRMGNMLANWLSTLRSYYAWPGHLPAGRFSDLRWSSGFKDGEFKIDWNIDHLMPSAGAERTAPGMVNEGHIVQSNHIVVTFRAWELPTGNPEEVRHALIGALRDGFNPRSAVSDEELAPLIRAIDHTEFNVIVNAMPRNAVVAHWYYVRMGISPRLLAAFRLGGIGRAEVVYPTTETLVANHYGVPAGERCFVPYPPDWVMGEPDPRVGPAALRASEATWNGIVARITSVLHNFTIRTSAHQYARDGDPASTRTLFLASPVERAIVRGHERNLLPTYPEGALADFLSTVNAADTRYETAPGPSGSGLVLHIRSKELSVPFWIAEDTARVPSQ